MSCLCEVRPVLRLYQAGEPCVGAKLEELLEGFGVSLASMLGLGLNARPRSQRRVGSLGRGASQIREPEDDAALRTGF